MADPTEASAVSDERPWSTVPTAADRRKATGWLGAAALGGVSVLLLVFLGAPSDPGPGGDVEALATTQRSLFAGAVGLLMAAVAWLALWLWVARRLDARMSFVAPPGWPEPPSGWRPTRSWNPDPDWPQAPADWHFWHES